MNIKALMFDFGGTIDYNGIAWKDRFQAIYNAAGITPPQEKFDRAFYDADDNLPLRHKLDGKGFEETVFLQTGDMFANLGLDPASVDRADVAGRFVQQSRDSFRSAAPLLAELKKKFRMGVISNFYGNLDTVLSSEKLDVFFDVVADSSRVGATKPDAKLFMHALDAVGVPPAQAGMVGDSLHRDMAGARALGMKCFFLWGERAGRDVLPPAAGDCVVMSSLKELSSLL
ncbi:MAG: HAD family hydrolase [Elusimicrobia bacterium]|nr:HAD family hydrolase [Elusimicrobiota bacterium]